MLGLGLGLTASYGSVGVGSTGGLYMDFVNRRYALNGAYTSTYPPGWAYTGAGPSLSSQGIRLQAADSAIQTHSTPAGDFYQYGQVEFTGAPGTFQIVYETNAGSAANRLSVFRTNTGDISAQVVVNTSVGGTMGAVAKTGARVVKWAVSRVGDLYTFAADGAVVGTCTAAGMPTLTNTVLGKRWAADLPLNDYMRTFVSRPGTISDAALQALTL